METKTIIPENYKSKLGLYDTQKAIGLLKKSFEENLCRELKLKRVSAPLFVEAGSGLNDDLNGVERPVSFDIPAAGADAQIVHSLAKWKRMALHKYDFRVGKGLYTDMNAIRRDEVMDNLHSVYVDQWDWERVIEESDRTVEFLQDIVTRIINAVCDTQEYINNKFPALSGNVSRNVKFITTQELEDMYPSKTSKEREYEIIKTYKTVFLIGIGDKLKSGKSHDGRAPDYDDWTLNGDILVWSNVLGMPVEISSMGIRVSPQSMAEQLKKAGCEERSRLPFHKELLAGNLPYTIGGGIGQSRLCMLILEKAHVGEVQVSIWDDETKKSCEEAGIVLL